MKILLIFIALFFFNFTQNSIYATVYNEIKEIEPINEVQEKIFLENETVKNDSFLKEKELSEENTTITANSDSNEVENNDALKIEVENENLSDSQKTNVPENNENISSKNETEEKPTIILKNVETNKNISTSEKTAEDLKIAKRETLKNEDRFEEISDRTNRVTALGSAMGAIDLGNTPTKKLELEQVLETLPALKPLLSELVMLQQKDLKSILSFPLLLIIFLTTVSLLEHHMI